MKRLLSLVLCIAMVMTMCVGLAACSKPSDTVDPDAEFDFLIVLITDKYMLGDKGINDSCWAGLTRLSEEVDNLKIECVETKSDYSASISEAVEKEPDLIICPSAEMASVLGTVASQYENTLFVLFDAELPDAFNVTTVNFNQEQSAFLAGVVAAMTTKKNVVGFIGSESNEITNKYLYGFTAGVVSSNNKCFISTNYIGANAAVRQAKETAVAQFKLGADVIFNVVGTIGSGIMNAADERGFKTISLTPEQAVRHPESSLCTISKNGEAICYDVASRLINGTFDGSDITYGLAEDAFYVDNLGGFITEDEMTEIDSYIQIIKAGGYVVPYDNSTYQDFISLQISPETVVPDTTTETAILDPSVSVDGAGAPATNIGDEDGENNTEVNE